MKDKKKDDKDVKVFATASIDGLDQDGKYLEVKTRDVKEEKREIMLEWLLQCTFTPVETIIQGTKTTEENETWIKKVEKLNLAALRLAHKEWEIDISLGAVYQIFNSLISRFDSFIEKSKDKSQADDQPEILIMKKKYKSKEILLDAKRRSITVLNSKFKKRFPRKE